FGGTSCANPNMAAMASLVWSANPNLTAAQVRAILEVTAMDLGSGGRDMEFGYGLVDAGAAVRRAVALARDNALASIYLTPPPAVQVLSPKIATGAVPTGSTSKVVLPSASSQAARGAVTLASLPPSVLNAGFAEQRMVRDVLSSQSLWHADMQH